MEGDDNGDRVVQLGAGNRVVKLGCGDWDGNRVGCRLVQLGFTRQERIAITSRQLWIRMTCGWLQIEITCRGAE